MGGAVGLHDVGRAGEKHAEVGVLLQSAGHALQEDLGLLVGTHDVDADGGHALSFLRAPRGPRLVAKQKRPTMRPASLACCGMALLGDDDLTVLIEPAVGAHGTRGHLELHVCGTTGVGGAAALLLLGYCHVELLLILPTPPQGNA